jgi:hypothetical protein
MESAERPGTLKDGTTNLAHMDNHEAGGELMPEEKAPQDLRCPWCAFTDVLLKKVLNHMETTHHQRYLDLALSPLIAGGGPV